MKFSTMYHEFYDNTFADAPVNSTLQESIAQKTLLTHTTMPFALQRIALRSAFAVLAITVSASLIAPHAFAQALASTSRAIRTNVTHAFESAQHLLSDEDIARLSEDPSVKSLDYTRDENGETFEIEKQCDPGTACNFSASGITADLTDAVNADEITDYRVHGNTDTRTGEKTLEFIGNEE